MQLRRRTLLQGAAAGALLPSLARAESNTLRIGIQYGVTYLPFAVMQHEAMVEKRAKALGLGDITISYSRSAGGTTMNDALLSGDMDCAATGFPSFFTLWSRGRGRYAIKGLMSYGTSPLLLLTRNPAVKALTDFTDVDRISVPAVKSSIQAIMLQMAADKQWGEYDRLDHLTVSRSHPDAIAGLLSDRSELDSAFSAPPYEFMAVNKPGIHVVTTAADIFGGPSSNGMVYLTERFHDSNPKLVGALSAGLREALALVVQDPQRAAAMYLEISGEKIDSALLQRTITAPGTIWEPAPRGTKRFADFMHKTGTIAKAPDTWKDVFFSEAYDLPGD